MTFANSESRRCDHSFCVHIHVGRGDNISLPKVKISMERRHTESKSDGWVAMKRMDSRPLNYYDSYSLCHLEQTCRSGTGLYDLWSTWQNLLYQLLRYITGIRACDVNTYFSPETAPRFRRLRRSVSRICDEGPNASWRTLHWYSHRRSSPTWIPFPGNADERLDELLSCFINNN